jgi:hypothetical protein
MGNGHRTIGWIDCFKRRDENGSQDGNAGGFTRVRAEVERYLSIT